MKVRIPDIPKEGLDVDIQETVGSAERSFPVSARLRIEKLEAEVFIRGDLRADVLLECSRCLKEFGSTLNIPVDVVYHPADELKDEGHLNEVKSEELELDFYSGEELDLLSLLQEQVELNIPMKPLCNEACKGMCPKCGTDLNRERCTCSEKETDPRFASLKKLLQERKE